MNYSLNFIFLQRLQFWLESVSFSSETLFVHRSEYFVSQSIIKFAIVAKQKFQNDDGVSLLKEMVSRKSKRML